MNVDSSLNEGYFKLLFYGPNANNSLKKKNSEKLEIFKFLIKFSYRKSAPIFILNSTKKTVLIQ